MIELNDFAIQNDEVLILGRQVTELRAGILQSAVSEQEQIGIKKGMDPQEIKSLVQKIRNRGSTRRPPG